MKLKLAFCTVLTFLSCTVSKSTSSLKGGITDAVQNANVDFLPSKKSISETNANSNSANAGRGHRYK